MNKKDFGLIAGVILIIGVLGFMPGIPTLRGGKDVIVNLVMASFLALYFLKNSWMSLFVLWASSSVLFLNYSGLLHGDVAGYIFSVTRHVQQFAFMIAFYEVLKSQITHPFAFLNVICVIGIVQSAVMVLQWFGLWIGILPPGVFPTDKVLILGGYPVFIHTAINLTYTPGLMDNPNISGSLLALCLPSFLRRGWAYFLPLIIGGFFLASSLGAVISAVAVIILWVWKRSPRYLWATIIWMIFIASLFMIKTGDITQLNNVITAAGRSEVWMVYLQKFIPLSPIFGYGLGMNEYLASQITISSAIKDVSFLHPHNEYLMIALETGLVGFILAIGFFADVCRKGFKLARFNPMALLMAIGVVGGLINCTVHFMLHTAVAIIFVLYVAGIEKLYDDAYYKKREDLW